DCAADPGRIAMYAGLAAFVGGAVFDIATAPRAARERNARDRHRVTVVPVVQPAGGGGLVVAGAF
ncbi:MAG: hypothetical protein M3680_29500, partial [Myxococcota bacterium]|nr:hypothetical protein [Myxococcota bacterium]